MELKFRKLKAEEIECRVGNLSKDGKSFTLLLYKDARVDMALLDEVVGVGNWQRKHEILGNDIYCSVGIYDTEKKEWVWKQDAGASGSIEEEKSKASDSFKRACVNLGIGRELYNAPDIWVNVDETNGITKYTRFCVKEIAYNGDNISKLVICKEHTDNVVFTYPKSKSAFSSPLPTKISEPDKKVITDYLGNCDPEKYNRFLEKMQSTYGVKSVGDLTYGQGKELASKVKANGTN